MARKKNNSITFDERASFIVRMFNEMPDKSFSLKHLASASGGATKEGRWRTQEIVRELLAEGTIEEAGREKYRLSRREDGKVSFEIMNCSGITLYDVNPTVVEVTGN